MKTIVLLSQKGGSGKSTSVCALAAGLQRMGRRVLVCDLDAQRNTTMQLSAAASGATVYDVLVTGTPARDAVQIAQQVAVIPSDRRLARAGLLAKRGDETRLKRALEAIQDDFDFCIVDTPPTLGAIVLNALTAADYVLIPDQPDRYGIDAMRETVATVDEIRRTTNPNIINLGVIVTRYRKNLTVHQVQAEQLQDQGRALSVKVYRPYIRDCAAVQEAEIMEASIYDLHRNIAADDYTELLQQILMDIE